MNKIDRTAIIELANDSSITKVGYMVYFSALAVSRQNNETECPEIHNFKPYQLYKNMSDKMPFINKSSVESAIKLMIELGYFEILENGTLVITNTGVGHNSSDEHFKSKGYVKLHHFIFSNVFYKLSIRAIRVVLMVLSRLNNSPVKREKFNFKSKKNPRTFKQWCKVLKVNRLAHIRYVIEELKAVFNIVELANNTFEFSLNTLSSAVFSKTEKLFRYTQEHLSKTKKMLLEANKKNIAFKPDQISQITEAICGYTMEVGRRVIRELCKTDRSNVKNLLGYTKGIIARLV